MALATIEQMALGEVPISAGDQLVEDDVLDAQHGHGPGAGDRLHLDERPAKRFSLIRRAGDQQVHRAEVGMPRAQQLAPRVGAVHRPPGGGEGGLQGIEPGSRVREQRVHVVGMPGRAPAAVRGQATGEHPADG